MEKEIQGLLNKTNEELYSILADQLINENLLQFVTPINEEEKKIQSEKWFSIFLQKEKLKQIICNSSLVIEKTKQEEVVAALVDVILQLYTNISSPLSCTLALLISRYGLQRYCSHDS